MVSLALSFYLLVEEDFFFPEVVVAAFYGDVLSGANGSDVVFRQRDSRHAFAVEYRAVTVEVEVEVVEAALLALCR